MKKYTQYRAAFFIALLGFNTLSGCVNTRSELGVHNRKEASCCSWERCWPSGRCGHIKRVWNELSLRSKICYVATGSLIAIGGAGIVFTWVKYIFFPGNQPNGLITSDSILPKCWNGTAVLNPVLGNGTLNPNMDSTTVASILNAIEKNETLYGNGTGDGGNTTTSDPADLFSGSVIQSALGNTTASDPAGSVATTGKIKDIGPETMQVLDKVLEDKQDEDKDSAIEFIKCLFENGLDINAKNSEGGTIFCKATKANNQEVVKGLLDEKGLDISSRCN